MSLRTQHTIAYLKGEPYHQTVGLKWIAQNSFELEYWVLFELLCSLTPHVANDLLEVLEEWHKEYRSGFSTWLGGVFSCNISIGNLQKGNLISAMKSYKQSLGCSLKEAHGIVDMLRYRIKSIPFELIYLENIDGYFNCTYDDSYDCNYDDFQGTTIKKKMKFSSENVAKGEFLLYLYINHVS